MCEIIYEPGVSNSVQLSLRRTLVLQQFYSTGFDMLSLTFRCHPELAEGLFNFFVNRQA